MYHVQIQQPDQSWLSASSHTQLVDAQTQLALFTTSGVTAAMQVIDQNGSVVQ